MAIFGVGKVYRIGTPKGGPFWYSFNRAVWLYVHVFCVGFWLLFCLLLVFVTFVPLFPLFLCFACLFGLSAHLFSDSLLDCVLVLRQHYFCGPSLNDGLITMLELMRHVACQESV